MKTARRHRVLVRVLFVLAVVIGLFAMFAVWANRQVLNTDNWTKTSGDLLENKNIQNAVGAYLVDQLFTSVNVPAELQKILPPQAQSLAGPAAGALHQVAEQAAPRLLARPKVQSAWRQANRAAHKELLTVINGGSTAVGTKNGDVVLNLRPLVDQLASNLGVESQVNAARTKLQGANTAKNRAAVQQKLGITLPPSTGQLTIMHSNDLSTVQDVAKGIHHLAVVLTAVALALFALAVWLAEGWRRVALRTTGWCFVALGLFVLLARRLVGDQIVDALASNSTVKPAAHSAWTIGTTLLYDIAIAMFAYGVLLVLAAWLAGSTRAAVATRRALAPSLRDRLGVVYAVIGLVFLIVIAWGPTPATRKPLGIALFAGLIVLGVQLLRREAAREFPDAQPGDTGRRVSAWWAGRRGGRDAGAAATDEAGSSHSVADRFDELDRLSALHDRGVLTDEEFSAQKGLILQGSEGKGRT